MMRVYHDRDADLSILEGRRIGVIGYGNQGRAQALNLRDSGLDVLVGNREDSYAERAREDGFPVLSIPRAVAEGDIVMLLIPDEVMPTVFAREIAPHLAQGNALVFASGYNIAFGFITPPPFVDVVLVAPRMIGAGVRDLYVAGYGFPSFIGVAQDASGQAKEIALALAKGIGSTRAGVVEVTFAQEAELDLFTEQCFGPAFGHVLTTAVDLLLEEGYPPEAVLLELYMSGELAYTLGKIAELGMIEQSELHSRTSQYGSMSRGMRFMFPELRARMLEGLEEIRSGQFAREWAAEQAAGYPTLKMLKEAARSLPIYQLERELREALHELPHPQLILAGRGVGHGARFEAGKPTAKPASEREASPAPLVDERGLLGKALAALGRLRAQMERRSDAPPPANGLTAAQMERILHGFLARVADDPALRDFSRGRRLTAHYVLSDLGLEFHMSFQDGLVTADVGPPPSPAEIRLTMGASLLDGMLTGRINAMRAAMTGKLSFSGDVRLAMSMQQIQNDLSRLYREAREETTLG